MTDWKNTTANVSRKAPLGMAEPAHRIPPPGVTSQQSVRSMPKSSVQQVKEICMYYVQKCSGQYQNNKAAARYVHQMAEEIMFQLAGVASEIKMTRGEPEVFQSLLEEWNEHFPPSLGAIGSPKAIANLVSSQAREIQKLKEELRTERTKRENDVSAVLRSMDVQLHSYRATVMNDRRQQKVLFNQEMEKLEDQMKEMAQSFEEEKLSMNNNHNKEYSKLESHYENLMKQSQSNLENVIKAHADEILQVKQKKQEKINKLKEQVNQVKQRLSEMKQKYNMLAVILNEDTVSTLDDEDADSLSISSDSSGEEEEVTSDLGSLVGVDLDKRKAEKEERKRKRAEDRSLKRSSSVRFEGLSTMSVGGASRMSLAGSVTGEGTAEELKQLKDMNIAAVANIKRLEKKLLQADNKHAKLEEEIAYLRKTIDDLIHERGVHMKHLKNLEELNEALRRALQNDLENLDLSQFEKTVDVKDLVSQMLCHTPHFLDRPDRGGLMKVPKNMSAYKTAGHF